MWQAIAYLHDLIEPIFHRDMKPENVLVNPSQHVKICDLGVGRFKCMSSILASTVSRFSNGTTLYSPPEILFADISKDVKKKLTSKADIWSTACVTIELYSEQVVWPISNLVFDLEEHVKEVIKKNCLGL